MKDVSFCQTCRKHVLSTEGQVEVVRHVRAGTKRTMTRFVCNACRDRKAGKR